MRLPITPVTTLQRELREQMRHNSPAGRVVVLVDGLDSEATRAFADSFAEIISEDGSTTLRASLTDFVRPRSERGAEPAAADIDVDTLRRVLLDPFREGGQASATAGVQLRAWDERRDQPVEARWVTAPEDAVLVLDGVFAQQEGIRGTAAFAVWLESPDSRLAERPGRSTDAPYTDAEFRYLREARPRRAASALIDISRSDRPVEFFQDSC